MGEYHYRNLTSAVDDKKSPLRQYLDRRFPNTRPLQADYKQQVGALIVDGSDAAPGTLGAAFDLMVRFTLAPEHKPTMAVLGFQEEPALLEAVLDVIAAAHESMTSSDVDLLAKASWALALATEVSRVGLLPGSPLAPLLLRQEFNAPTLLALAPDGAMRQLRELHRLAAERLLPTIVPTTHLYLGPTFDGSAFCPADADLIHDGRLLDIKTRLGRISKKTGARADTLALADLYQIVAYALFDLSDSYEIDSLGLYSARYGTLVAWPLVDALETMAGDTISVESEREMVWRLLAGPSS